MSKEIKAVLKEARELFKKKEYTETVKLCKKILKEEKANYGALVLLGAAMREVESLKSQTAIPLKKATEIQPDNPVAWQGIIAFYEKEDNPETWVELIVAYCQLLKLDSNPEKADHFLNNLEKFVVQLKDDKILGNVVSDLNQLRESLSENRIKRIDLTLASILTKYSNLPNTYEPLFESTLSSVINDVDNENKHMYYKRYLKLLYKRKKPSVLLAEAVKMHELFSQDIYPLEWICRVYSEESISNGQCEGIEITYFFEALLKLNAESEFAFLAKAIHLHQAGSLLESRNILHYITSLKSTRIHSWILLGEICLRLYCWEEAENAAMHALKLLQDNTHDGFQNRVNLILIEALAKSSNKYKWEEAIQKCEKLLPEASLKRQLFIVRAYINLKDSKALELLNKLDDNPETKIERAILKAIDLKNKLNLEEAADVLGSVLETAEAWLTLGKIHWEMADFGHSLMAFLKGIHADPYNWECFLYLGHYYRECGNDIERAKKCYQKALQINPNSEESGIGLSRAYRLLKETDANLELLQKLTERGGGPKWAWLQLGLQLLERKEISEAISALRNAIKVDPNDNHCWECLADAYLARGAHTSALKSYERAFELSPESIYPLIQIANVHLLIGQYNDAKERFKTVLTQKENYLPALKGLAETYLKIAKENIVNQQLGRGRENLQEAVNNLVEAIVVGSSFICLWKLLGDACYKIAVMPEDYCYLNIAPGLIKLESSQKNVTIKREEIFALAVRCFCRALYLSKDSSLLWHDLACCYLAQVHFDPSVDRKTIALRSLEAAKQAVRLSPSSSIHWNILGVICMTEEIKNYALAQHSFITAIDEEPNNAISWANLGTLYLLLEDFYKANEAFSRAQTADPAYVNSWIGQGIIAEKLAKHEAMDLFRHATQLGYHSEAALGYCHWVLNTLLNPETKKDDLYVYSIKKMYAVPVATDEIYRYITSLEDKPHSRQPTKFEDNELEGLLDKNPSQMQKELAKLLGITQQAVPARLKSMEMIHKQDNFPKDAYARNSYGLLLERQKLYKSAAEQFSLALECVTNDVEKDAVLVNLARIMIAVENYSEAIEISKRVQTATFKSHSQLALALFKAELYEESYSSYEAVLQWFTDSGPDKAYVLCAMAAIANMFQELDDVKTLLFQSIEIHPPVPSGLFAAAALGLLHNDKNLTTLVLNELKLYEDHDDYRHHVTLLSAYLRFSQNGITEAIKVVSKFVHRHPDDEKLWIILTRFLLEVNTKAFQNCAEKALVLGRNTDMLQISCIKVLSDLISTNGRGNIRSVLKLVHSFPANAESWSILIAALLPRCASRNSKPSAHWLTVLCSIIRKSLLNRNQSAEWLLQNEKKASETADKVEATYSY